MFVCCYVNDFMTTVTRVSFKGGEGICPPLQEFYPLSLGNQLSHFFQRVIGCNEYRTESQHKEYTA